ncbi:hypothetical protein ADL30_05380 [Streptomyces sp. NRRL S-1521]|nr:hypothetical protein ADL30_05380 [Streptomyces sp. NRRL S-1521]
MFSGEGASGHLASRLRAHLISCTACVTADCEEGAQLRHAFRAIRTLLRPPEPTIENLRRGVQR